MTVRSRTLTIPTRAILASSFTLRWPCGIPQGGALDFYIDMAGPLQETRDTILSFGVATGSSLGVTARSFDGSTVLGMDVTNGVQGIDYGIAWTVHTVAGRTYVYDTYMTCQPAGVQGLVPTTQMGAPGVAGPQGAAGVAGNPGQTLPPGVTGQLLTVSNTGQPTWVDQSSLTSGEVIDGGWF